MEITQKEKQVVGFLIISKNYIPEALKKIRPDDFLTESYAQIYDIIIDCFTNQKEIDEIVIAEKYGNSEFIETLITDNSLTSASFLTCIDSIKKESTARKTTIICQDLLLAIQAKDNEKIETLKQQLLETSKQTSFQPESISSLSNKYIENYNSPREEGFSTGLPSLDYLTGGFQQGDFITISARTGIGKTNLCLNAALNCARKGKKVLFISLEMLPNQLLDRLIAMHGKYNAHEIRRKELDNSKIKVTLTELRDMPLKILFASELTSLDVFTIAYTESVTDGIDIIFVDYLGRLFDKLYTSEEEKLTRICRNLKNCGLKLQIPVISPVQIDKVSAKGGAQPAVEDAKGSTSIGHESDLSLALVRKDRAGSETKLYITKNRHGNAGEIDLHFDLKTLIFTEVSTDQAEPESKAIQPVETKPLNPEDIPF